MPPSPATAEAACFFPSVSGSLTWSRSTDSLYSEWATSTRKPSTPRSSQNRSTSSNIAGTSGLRQFRSGWVAVEEVEVPLVGTLDPVPGRPAEDGVPVVGRLVAVGALAREEQVALALGAAGLGGQRLLEPRVLAGGVVGHDVEDDLEAQLVGAGEQVVGVAEPAEERVDVGVVGDVVAVVVLGGGEERRDPEAVDAEVAQVLQAGGDARAGRRCRRRRSRRRSGRRPGRERRSATSLDR